MNGAAESIAALYSDVPGVLRRAGRTYPVALTPVGGRDGLALGDAVRAAGKDVCLDATLVAGGRPHLDTLRAAGRVHDGRVLCLHKVTPDGVSVARSGYFDMLATCDAVRAELVRAAARGPVGWQALPLRRRLHAVAGDPLTSGRGRAAALGVSVLLTVPLGTGSERGVVLGRRSDAVATDPGRWHVAPSGMLEDAADGRHVAQTVATELAEEVGLRLTMDDVDRRARLVGCVTDLYRLRPDLVVRLDLDAPAGLLTPGPEFSELTVVPLTRKGFDAFWAAHAPDALTPPAAGALALAEAALTQPALV